jgi:hypothetical protein
MDSIDENKDGLPTWLFTGNTGHERKMLRARDYLPHRCSHFTPRVNLLKPSDKTGTVTYKVWRDKDVQTATISRPAWITGTFADANILQVSMKLQEWNYFMSPGIPKLMSGIQILTILFTNLKKPSRF